MIGSGGIWMGMGVGLDLELELELELGVDSNALVGDGGELARCWEGRRYGG